jgi:uncharacterized protein
MSRKRIAIVGTGVSGLVTAHLLHPHHDILVFEAGTYVGGHVHTIPVRLDDRVIPVDTGFIVYNERNYPYFTTLLAQLGVDTQPSTMSFSVRLDEPELEYNGSTISQLFAQRRNALRPSHYRMLLDIPRFHRNAPAAILNGAANLTLGEYVQAGGYSSSFMHRYLVPMGAAIWSMPPRSVLEMPASFFVRFLDNHGMLTVNDRPQWRVIAGGSARYIERLIMPFVRRIRLRTPVTAVKRNEDSVAVNGELFDHVVFACHSDQALATLLDPSPAERMILGALRYQSNEVALHTDESILPRRRAAWAAWNYHMSGNGDDPVAVTYNMNVLQSLDASRALCVTLNATDRLDPATVIETFTYAHPLFTTAGIAAQRRRGEISGVRRTHYAGAYWGFGFHEDGVVSAIAVARGFGVPT